MAKAVKARAEQIAETAKIIRAWSDEDIEGLVRAHDIYLNLSKTRESELLEWREWAYRLLSEDPHVEDYSDEELRNRLEIY